MDFKFNIPTFGEKSLEISLRTGNTLFLLGANGSGKSSIMQLFAAAQYPSTRRIFAHRQTWFASDILNYSAEQKRNTESSIRASDYNPQSRFRDDYSHQRPSLAIFDLVVAENIRARKITAEADKGDYDLVKALSKVDAPIKVINELLRYSNIPIEISIQENDRIVAIRNGSEPYGATELSDGERNAILISAEVLTVPENTLLLIDEPERHLHRSIISPLLSLLFAKREDCAFIISTHDVMLPMDNVDADTLLVRECKYVNSKLKAVDCALVKTTELELNDDIKKDILGSRKQIVFIEGTSKSLDMALYNIIFPSVSIVPRHNSKNVEQTVGAINDLTSKHWISAFGIIDKDGRSTDEIEKLKESSVFAISEYSVESIYYHCTIQESLAKRQSDLNGSKTADILENARAAALLAIEDHKVRLCDKLSEWRARAQIFDQLPTSDDISDGKAVSIVLDIAELRVNEATIFEDALSKKDLQKLMSRYAIRETPALDKIAEKLGFQNRKQYEASVRKLLQDDRSLLTTIRNLFGGLYESLKPDASN